MILQLLSIVLSLVFIVHYLYYIISSLLKREMTEDAKFIKKLVVNFLPLNGKVLESGKINKFFSCLGDSREALWKPIREKNPSLSTTSLKQQFMVMETLLIRCWQIKR
jgi:hypothetical protein